MITNYIHVIQGITDHAQKFIQYFMSFLEINTCDNTIIINSENTIDFFTSISKIREYFGKHKKLVIYFSCKHNSEASSINIVAIFKRKLVGCDKMKPFFHIIIMYIYILMVHKL